MKIDNKDIRQRLKANTAIDREEIEALCDLVERKQIVIDALLETVEALKNEYINGK